MNEALERMRGMKNLRAQHSVNRTQHFREIATRRPNQMDRTWLAGQYDDLTADWAITPQWAYSLTHYLSNLRARARSEYRTNDFARRYVGLLKSGVVGPNGFTLQAQFEDPRGRDMVASQAFEKHWKRWAQDPRACDVRRVQTLTEMCHQWMLCLATDGEVFVRVRRSGPWGFSLQTIEPLTIDHTYMDELPNGNVVRFGVEVDGNNAPVAFYKNTGNARDFPYPYPTGERERIPASEIYHLYLLESIDQVRGFPWLSTPMYRMHMLGGFEESALINARAGAAKMGFKKQRDPERYQGEGGIGAGVEETPPGLAVDYLNENEEWVAYDPTYPTGDFKDYVQQMLRGVASGLEMSYPTLANDLAGVNYSSLRHDALTERDTYMRLQNWMADHLLTPLYNDWLSIQLMRGIPIPRNGGGSRPANVASIEKYRDIRWIGRRWQWVDPQKEIQAAAEAVQLGVTTRAQIIRDNGRDPDEVFEEWEDEQRKYSGVISSLPGGASAEPGAPDRPDSDAESDDSSEGSESGSEDS